MMKKNNISVEQKVEAFLNQHSVFDTKSFFELFRGEPATTIYSRIRELIKQGRIHRVGRGKYAIGATNNYSSRLGKKEVQLYSFIKKEFPYSNSVIWKLNNINELLQHLINVDLTIIDIDRDSVESLYWLLKGKGYRVVTRKRMLDGLAEYNGYILIRPLVTSSPIKKADGIYTATLEKILVDVACDKEFVSFQGSELKHLYRNAYNEYTINTDKLLRYAGRKEKRDNIKHLLKLINQPQSEIA